MRKYEHGGDIFAEKNRITDFSVNINPLGMPQSASEAAQKAVREEISYPDPFCRRLTAALSERYGIPEANIVCGNGASDLILRLCAAVRPEKVYVPAPGFSEYARSAELFGADIVEYAVPGFDNDKIKPLKYTLKTSAGEAPRCDEDTDVFSRSLFFVCRPNNPDGSLMSIDELREIASACEEKNSLLVVDECFLEFTDGTSALALLGRQRNIVVINAFTKTYAMAGLRLGFMFSADTELLDEVYRFGTPWSVSSAAQAAGIACCGETGFLTEARRYIAKERKRLISAIEALGLNVFPSEANFLLIKDDKAVLSGPDAPDGKPNQDNINLREALLARGIKVRACGSFTGLDDSYIRIGIRTSEENDGLIRALRDILKERSL